MDNEFFKGHGLGNDYIAVDPAALSFELTPDNIRTICDRHWGVGSDGILALASSQKADFGLRIYNPDGSEAEKSGNGLRIFARYLHATGQVQKQQFTVETEGGLVSIELHIDQHGDASTATGADGAGYVCAASLALHAGSRRAGRAADRCRRADLDLYRRQRRQPPLHHLSRTGVLGGPRTNCALWGRSWKIIRSSPGAPTSSSPCPWGLTRSTS